MSPTFLEDGGAVDLDNGIVVFVFFVTHCRGGVLSRQHAQ